MRFFFFLCLATSAAFVAVHHQHRRHTRLAAKKKGADDAWISEFCQGTNEFWKTLAVEPFREAVATRPAGTADSDFLSKVLAPPESPGIPRHTWLVIAASVPTGLLWYGYYKFSIEEELFQYELQTTGKVSGCGGYGTLLPFAFGVLLGGPLALLHLPPGEWLLKAASLWILGGQVNLYRRVNELLPEPVLYEWWALLPPPLDVVVGLRQVHFLAEYWTDVRGGPRERDLVAEDLFPFIARTPRFTLKQFLRTPSMWFWFTKDWPDFTYDILQDDYGSASSSADKKQKQTTILKG
mmetsp:Transcript_13670/g.41333  ORF Transcript_13670/g.41333 Transcript_13670/m.41333 type:complete len:295 (+) Transcript_13670:92-976(+)